jgi:hypothetical protein
LLTNSTSPTSTMIPQLNKITHTKKVAALSTVIVVFFQLNGAACENRTRDTNLEGSGNTILRTPLIH